METWVSLGKEMPDLKGYIIHVSDLPVDNLERRLLELGFVNFKINGARVRDKGSFFAEIQNALEFPAYFGRNWDAWDDSLSEFYQSAPRRVAIIWEHASETYAADTQTFLQAVCDLYYIAMRGVLEARKRSGQDRQIELFIIK